MSHRDFQEYLGLLGRLLRLRTGQRKAIEDELRAHMEERLAALTAQGIESGQAVSMALAEFGDAAALAAEFTAISRLQKRRWMMRFTVGSIAASIVLAALVVSLWPDASGQLAGPTAQAQQVAPVAPQAAQQPLPEQVANERTQARLAAQTAASFVETPLAEVLGNLAGEAGVQVYVDRRVLEEVGITAEEAPITINLKDVPAEMILRLVLRQHGLAYSLDHGVVIVSAPEELETQLDIRVYRIHDLVQPAARQTAIDTAMSGGRGGRAAPSPYAGQVPVAPNHVMELIDLITSTVEPETWDSADGPATIGQYRGALVISQTADVHRKVQQLLDGLREVIAK